MARQSSPFKFTGTIGDMSFYKSKDGHLIREKGGVSGERIKKDPKYQRTRENNAEFGNAAKAVKLILKLRINKAKLLRRLLSCFINKEGRSSTRSSSCNYKNF